MQTQTDALVTLLQQTQQLQQLQAIQQQLVGTNGNPPPAQGDEQPVFNQVCSLVAPKHGWVAGGKVTAEPQGGREQTHIVTSLFCVSSHTHPTHLQALLDDFDYSDEEEEDVEKRIARQRERLQAEKTRLGEQ